jgi:aldose 1-epimerase
MAADILPPARERMGTTPDGVPVDRITLRNRRGLRVGILSLGGIVAALEAPDREGRSANIVLGLATVAGYLERSPHFGALTGRFANRIAQGRFTLDGQVYELLRNDGPNTLHGGKRGFDKVVWEVAEDGFPENRLRLSYVSPDGEEGFPGTLRVAVDYTLGEASELRIDYEATTDRPTIVNLTNHSYFNLAGEGSGDILGNEVEIAADHFTPVDETMIPTGEIRPVAGTPFDFTRPTALGIRIRDTDEQLLRGRGYDHNFVLRGGTAAEPRLAARIRGARSGRVLEVSTTAPGLQLYTGNMLTGALAGPSGRAYRQGDGVCLETQGFPDAPNHANFPSAVLRPGERYRSTTIWRFSTDRG